MSKNQYRIAVVGATTLLGKEVGDEIAESPLATATTLLLDTEDSSGTLEAIGDEATFIQPLEPAALENLDVAIFTDAKMFAEHGRTARQMGAAVVDATGTGEPGREALVRSPLAAEVFADSAPLNLETIAVTVAHPIATMLALVLGKSLAAGALTSVAATVLQPASENGRAALDELQQQTVNLLSFQSVPREEFDAQVAFNLLPSLGEAAKAPIDLTEARIRRHLRVLAGNRLPDPLLQIIQAPVFHGFAVSLFIEFAQPVALQTLLTSFKSESIDLVGEEGDPPSNLSSAGQAQILLQVKSADADAETSTRFALWMTADNLKLAARTAVACALELTRMRPLGIVQ